MYHVLQTISIGEFDETADGHQVLAANDRDDQRGVQRRCTDHVVDRRQVAAVSAQDDLQQTGRGDGKR